MIQKVELPDDRAERVREALSEVQPDLADAVLCFKAPAYGPRLGLGPIRTLASANRFAIWPGRLAFGFASPASWRTRAVAEVA